MNILKNVWIDGELQPGLTNYTAIAYELLRRGLQTSKIQYLRAEGMSYEDIANEIIFWYDVRVNRISQHMNRRNTRFVVFKLTKILTEYQVEPVTQTTK